MNEHTKDPMIASETESKPVRQTIARWLALGGVLGPIFFVAAFTIAGALRPGYSPISQAISALGTGMDGWQEDLPAILLGVLLLAFTLSFYLAMRSVLSATSRIIGSILLAIVALVWITVGVFTAAPSTRTIHTVASVIGEVAAIVALFVIGIGLGKAPSWRAWSIYTIATTVVALVTLLLTFITSQRALSASVRIGGLLERLLVVEILAWFVAFGVKLARLEAASPSPMPLHPTEQGGVR